jgi:NAD+ synthase
MNINQGKEHIEKNFLDYFSTVQKTGIERVIVGVSGGIDSAVTLAIAVHSLGKENVFAYLMPYKLGEISSHQNFADAQEICEFFQLPKSNVQSIPIDEYAKPYEHIFSGKNSIMAFGNTLARIRMTLLFGFANAQSGIVLGTCNKSEIMLGYETKFGDGACDINILGNLWKSEVYQLAKLYNIPEKFIEKTPSAELFPDHSDEEEMGFSYDKAQEVLEQIEKEEKNFSPENRVEEKIFSLWKNSAHKREFPPTLTI